MLATNLGFSIVFLEGLKSLGFNPTEQEIEGVFHLWKYIGFLLGIPHDYLPENEIQAISELYQWTMTQAPADEDTKALALALMNEPLTASYPKGQWHKKLQVKIHLGYNNYFMKKRACDLMGLPMTYFRYLPYLTRSINAFWENRVLRHPDHYSKAVSQGRKRQEKIKYLFLKGHGKHHLKYGG